MPNCRSSSPPRERSTECRHVRAIALRCALPRFPDLCTIAFRCAPALFLIACGSSDTGDLFGVSGTGAGGDAGSTATASTTSGSTTASASASTTGGSGGSATSGTGSNTAGPATTVGAATGGGGASTTGAGGTTVASATGVGGAATGGIGGAGGSTGGSSGSGGSAGSTIPDAGDAGPRPPDGGALEPPPGMYGRRAPLLVSNSEMAVAELDGKIYVLGGYPSSGVTQPTVQVYDPATDKWAFTVPLPVPIHHPVAVGVNGKLYSLGGQLMNADTNRTLVFDPAAANPSWVDLQTMSVARGAGAGAAIDDKIYVVGGRPPAGNAFEVYDISDNRWTTLPNLPQVLPNRNHIAAAAIGGKIYVAGGRYNGGSFSSPITASLDMFDPLTGTWQSKANMLRPRGGLNGVAAYGCFYTWGGEGTSSEPNGVFPDHDVYNPLSNSWTALTRLPTPVHGVTGGAFINGLIYIPGGGTSQGGSSGSTIFQVYRPVARCE